MRIEELKKFIEKLSGKLNFEYKFGDPKSFDDIKVVEDKFNIKFPDQVVEFYSNINGLSVNSPQLEVYCLEKLLMKDELLYFAKFDGKHEVAFLTNKSNVADQWDIINPKLNFCVTHTMASFWSNKIQVWLKSEREIWAEEIY